MSKTPFMPLWVSDFLGDTLDLDATEIGAYMLLLMAQWNRDGASLPNDQKKLQRVARCGRNWPKVWAAIERYFSIDDDGVYSKRLRLESQSVAAKREVNAHNGSRGGRAKALKNKDGRLAKAKNSPQRNPSIPEPESIRDTNVSLARSEPKPPDRFGEFWEAYPHRGNAKKGKAKAMEKYQRHVKAGVSQQEIIEGAKRYAADRRVIEGFAKDPTTWLNNQCWCDEIEPARLRAIPGGKHPVADGGCGQSDQLFAAFAGVIPHHPTGS